MKTMKQAYGKSYSKLMEYAKTSRYFKEVKSLLRTLNKYGFTPHSVDDTEELIATPTQTEAAIAVCNVDEARLFVTKESDNGTKKMFGLFLVLGNDDGEVVCDCSVDDDLDKATTEHYNRWCKY
jgi:hypothetical protein